MRQLHEKLSEQVEKQIESELENADRLKRRNKSFQLGSSPENQRRAGWKTKILRSSLGESDEEPNDRNWSVE